MAAQKGRSLLSGRTSRYKASVRQREVRFPRLSPQGDIRYLHWRRLLHSGASMKPRSVQLVWQPPPFRIGSTSGLISIVHSRFYLPLRQEPSKPLSPRFPTRLRDSMQASVLPLNRYRSTKKQRQNGHAISYPFCMSSAWLCPRQCTFCNLLFHMRLHVFKCHGQWKDFANH